jgi:HlyD family secretion protein
MKTRAMILLCLGVALSGCGRETDTPIWGYVEGERLLLGPEEGGRLESLSVTDGTRVEEGAPLFLMDGEAWRRELAAVEARRDAAAAALADLEAPASRPEDLAVLEAAKVSASAAVDNAQADYGRQAALAGTGAASQARLEDARLALRDSEAALAEAESRIRAALLPARPDAVARAQAELRAAEAAADQARLRLERRAVSAPASGSIEDIYFRPGEVVGQGRPVLALLPPGNLRLRFYVGETERAKLALGAPVSVSCDACPEGLDGRISFISREAEYTPPVIFSAEERRKLVWLVEAVPGERALEVLTEGQPVTLHLSGPGNE